MNRLTAFGIILVTGFLGSACSDNDSATGPSTSARIEGTWSLVAFEPSVGSVEAVDDPQDYTVEFSSDGHLGMRADCNSCSGSFETRGVEMGVGALACTRAFCAPPSESDAFIAAVSDTSSYLRQEQTLFLHYDGGRLRLQAN